MFITAGEGPVPDAAIAQIELEPDIEGRIAQLSRRGGFKTVRHYPIMDSFERLAERGFYVFDWSDVHETRASKTGEYQLVMSPESELRSLEDVSILGMEFRSIPVVVRSFSGRVSVFVSGAEI